MKEKFKEFRPSSWAIDNKTSIYILTVIITLAGILTFINLPKEKFPDIVIPTIFVSTVYPGTSPADIENLVTRPLEKQIKAISGVKKLSSNSVQDFSSVMVEFSTSVDVAQAKQKVKDAVDKARIDLPKDLPRDPDVVEVDFSEMPILFINLSGKYDLNTLKKYAEAVKDKVESLKEITRVDIVGALEREIQVNVDMYKMQSAKVTLGDIERAIAMENLTIAGGVVKIDEKRRSIRVVGDFANPIELNYLIVKSSTGAPIYLSEIAEIKDGFKEKESYARLDHQNVITLNVVKKSGENLIESSDKIREIVKELQENEFPENLKITLTGDQSEQTRVTISDLINTIIIGFVLVLLVLMFFMGVTNAFFVALSVPLSMFLAFLVMPTIGFTLNMIVLFAFLLALGIVVDDAIVVIENTHRLFENGKRNIKEAAKMATGEVFLPVLSGTLTTLAPFVPLAFWSGVIGKFMYFLPITLIITLTASLLVAYIINPVFAVDFMKAHPEEGDEKIVDLKKRKRFAILTIVGFLLAGIFYATGLILMGNLIVFPLMCVIIYRFILSKAIAKFQKYAWPSVQNKYEKVLDWSLSKRRPIWLLIGTVCLLFLSFFVTGLRQPKVVFFPKSDPNFIYVYLTLPVGTDQSVTDSVVQGIEKRVYGVIGESNPLVESVISNVAVGAGDPMEQDRSVSPHKGKVSIAFVKFSERHGKSTEVYLDKIREAVKEIPNAEISVDQEQGGPPVGKPISIEITGEDFKQITLASINVKKYLDSLQIRGVEELKSDVQLNKPEILIEIDRERANREGLSTAQVGMEIRTAVFGKEVSKFRDNEDEYPIQLRYLPSQRNDIDALLNLKLTFRDMGMGGVIRQIPLSSVATIKYSSTYGGIKRKNQKRVITLSSNVLSGFTPNEVVAKINRALTKFHGPSDVSIKMAGEQEDQKESMNFLSTAMLISLGLIFFILVSQFNSLAKPLLILSEIIFCIIGVLLGLAIFDMEISIVMTGIGIVALAGIVVRNGILLVEFTDVLIERGYKVREAIIEAGKVRMTPVLLTATATILGLVPLAIGFNIDFAGLFTSFEPKIHLGGDSVAFWGPLSWTIIFGLGFATFLTLILVPVMYYIMDSSKIKVKALKKKVR